MKIIHLSYHISRLIYHDPELWLKRINSTVGVLNSMARFADIEAIYHIRYKGVLRKKNVTYHFLDNTRWQLLFPFRFNDYVKKLKPDAIIVHGLIFPWQVLMLRWQLGSDVKIIAQHHAERPLRDIRQYFQQWADRYIGAYLFCSLDQGKLWVEKKQIGSLKKIKEIMGTSSSFHVMEKSVAQSTTKVTGDIIYLWVGRLDENKDPLLVARAFIRFAKNNPSVKLYMIYQTFQLLDELKNISSPPSMEKFVHLVGEVANDKLQEWYNSVDFIISSSHYEGSGVAVCEGLSCGCIPILTNIPSFRMMTDEGRIGLLFQPGNENELLQVFEKSLELDRKDMKNLVLKRFQEKLSFEANATAIMEVLQEL